jgi:sugar phosphate isomerase/epimerase
MKKLRRILFCAFTTGVLAYSTDLQAQQPEEKHGWQLGAQAWTFRTHTFAQTLDTISSIGLKYVQAFPTQKIGGGMEGTMDYHMPPEKRKQILDLLKSKGIKMVSYGVTGADNEGDWKKLFEFASSMGLESIAVEPSYKDMPLVSKLADEYKVNVAIHNHPQPTLYWNPDTVLKHISGLSKRIGVNADIGHWVRSGLDPVESMKKFQGRIYALHFKDLDRKPSEEMLKTLSALPAGSGFTRELIQMLQSGPHDVIWGTGVSNIKGVMAELKRQGFKGPVFAEYEYNWGKNAGEVKASAAYFRTVAQTL